MKFIETVIRKITEATTPTTKLYLRTLVERWGKSTKGEFFGQFGEDAFLRGYFEARSWQQSHTGSLTGKRHPIGHGFYVDVGAFSPKTYSNTYMFYHQGWRGINIDPSPGGMQAFVKLRPHDQNLEIGVSDVAGERDFFHWSVPAVVNTLSPEHARHWTQVLGRQPRVTRIKVLPLRTIFDQYLPQGQAISFMNIDVEGHDLEVLRSNDWTRYRPELVLVELDSEEIEVILRSEIVQYMSANEYKLIGWIRPTLAFRDAHCPLIAGE